MSPTPPPPPVRVDHSEDVLPLLRAGESPEHIARRLGLKPGSVARSLRRYGLPEHARAFDRVAARTRVARVHPWTRRAAA